MTEPRTAVVTGAGKRVGAHLATALVERGWTVLAHVRRDGDEVPDGTVRVASDLADPACADVIFEAARDLPPVRLLVNNAARFAWDSLAEFSAEEFDRHMHVNVRAPVLLTQALAARHGGGDALVVNVLDSKLSAPNPDFLSYTLSKQALLGFTEIAARSLAAKEVRVNAIAPSLMLQSPGQSEENFRAMHANNPLGRGVSPEQIVAAIDYLLAAATVTGEVLTIDAGQRFSPPPRDVQFLES
jgi:NAD(P)-dependent dehydrogenase (short-subunit alcohol dehydrogenase family)